MVRTGFQLYTLRELEGRLPTLLQCVGETDFDGVEFAGFGETSPDEAATVIEEVGFEALQADHDGEESGRTCERRRTGTRPRGDSRRAFSSSSRTGRDIGRGARADADGDRRRGFWSRPGFIPT